MMILQFGHRKNGKLKPVEVKRGNFFKFFGMTLNFKTLGECHVLQEEKVEDLISFWPEDIKKSNKELTPCTSSLFEKGEGGLLSSKRREVFHTTAAKGLFIANQSWPDILPTISLLTSRVKEPNELDWKKARRMIQYLANTKELHLVLRYDGT